MQLSFLAPALLLILAVTIYPLVYSLWASVRDIRLSATIAPADTWTLSNYATALAGAHFRNSAWLTAVFTVSSVAAEWALGFLLALYFWHPFPGHRITRSLILLPTMVAPVTVGIIWKLMLNSEFGLIGAGLRAIGLQRIFWLDDPQLALAAIVIMDVWQWTPFMFLLLLAGMAQVPEECLEAAQVDGANRVQLVRLVLLPLMRRITTIAVVFRSLYAVCTFDTVYTLTKGGPGLSTDLFSLLIYREGFRHFNVSYASAISYLVLLLVLAAVWTVFRRSLRADEVA